MVYSTRQFVLCLALCYFVHVFFSPFSIAITSLGEERANLGVLVRFSDLRLFGFVCFLFLLVSGMDCGLWLWHSLDFSLTFFSRSPSSPVLSQCFNYNYVFHCDFHRSDWEPLCGPNIYLYSQSCIRIKGEVSLCLCVCGFVSGVCFVVICSSPSRFASWGLCFVFLAFS